jgi:hypothetical protein
MPREVHPILEILLLLAAITLPVVVVLGTLSVAGSFIALLAEQGLPPIPRQPMS